MVEGARLESVFRGNSNVGSNPTLSASLESIAYKTGTIPACNRVNLIMPELQSTFIADIGRSAKAGTLRSPSQFLSLPQSSGVTIQRAVNAFLASHRESSAFTTQRMYG